MKVEEFLDLLVSPADKSRLRVVASPSNAAGDHPHQQLTPAPRKGLDATPMGVTDRLLVCEDGESAFPLIDDIPVLLEPERLVSHARAASLEPIDLNNPKYAEAYQEMEFYNQMRNEQLGELDADSRRQILGGVAQLSDLATVRDTFPLPEEVWVDARHDAMSQLQAYSYLAPVRDKVFLQLGGSGSHAVKVLMAGAKSAILLTPMLGEARFALRLAESFGVADRLGCVLAVGEELPFAAGSIDLVYSGGCFHHMRLDHVAAELSRVLREGGRFSGVDPWKTPLHTLGTKVLGKREPSVFCRPITEERLKPMREQFSELRVIKNGPYLRYLFLGLDKAGVRLSLKTMLKVARADNAIGTWTGTLNRYGGSLVIAGCN